MNTQTSTQTPTDTATVQSTLQPTRLRLRCIESERIIDPLGHTRYRARLVQTGNGYESGVRLGVVDLMIDHNEGEPELVPEGSMVTFEIAGE